MRRIAVALVTAVLGCQPEVVKWEEPKRIEATVSTDKLLSLQGTSPVFVDPARASGAFSPANGCAGSLRFARGVGDELYAAWWSVRADSSASLLASRSADGGVNWSEPVTVDSTDVSRVGCVRYPPAVAVDSVTKYFHVVYGLENATGAGIFFSHSMERGALFHAPVAIVYGKSPASADVAADSGRVVVAYEDPNLREQSPGRIALAISATSGHIFEQRLPVSGGTAAVAAPRVAMSSDRVAVSWIESPNMIAGQQYRVVRVGRLANAAIPSVIVEPDSSQDHGAAHTGAVPAQP